MEKKFNSLNILPAVLFSVFVFLPVCFLALKTAGNEINSVYPVAWSLFVGAVSFYMVFSEKINFGRKVFFISLAAAFLIHFKLSLIADVFKSDCFQNTPYCHIAISSSFFNYLYQQYLALTNGDWKTWGPLSLGFLWVFITLVTGRAWCSWTCFYGGIDELFSSLSPKRLLKFEKIGLRFRDFPMALLIFFLIISFSEMAPSFCEWLCPLKFSSAFMSGNQFFKILQIIFMGIALLFLIILPVFLKKRAFCSFLCPFGAWQSFFGKINPFRIKVDADKCAECGKCFYICPVFAIKKDKEGKPEISDYCNLCGVCADICPEGCYEFSVFGFKTFGFKGNFGKLLSVKYAAIYSFIVFSGVFGSLFAPAAAYDVVKLLRNL